MKKSLPECRILFDVGGTFLKSSLGIRGMGPIEDTFASVPMPSAGSAAEIIDSIRESLRIQTENAARLGMKVTDLAADVPGPFDYASGRFLMKHKFATVYGMSFYDILGDDLQMTFMHDVNCALLGHIVSDPALRIGNVALVTLGTGLGFAYATGGKIAKTPEGAPAESLWNQPYRDGILEDFVSRRGIIAAYGGSEGIDVKEISERARKGDTAASAAFESAGKCFAEGAAPLLKKLGIGHLVFAGQISRSFDLIRPGIGDALQCEISVSPDIQGAVFKGLAFI
ncbi:MAG: ROK family protein [Bacteroidales bacterium]|nr:ROK family protein [Bacteroidales bacterium]